MEIDDEVNSPYSTILPIIMLERIFNISEDNTRKLEMMFQNLSYLKGKELKNLRSMKLKYNYGTHNEPYWYDPITG